MKKAVVLMALLAGETAVASLTLAGIAPYILVSATITVGLLVALDKINHKAYPIYLYGLGLAAVWQTSMLGSYIVGVDIYTEMSSARYVIANGWNPAWGDSNNTSVVIGIVTPWLSRIIDPVWQFKVLYPAMFAAVPMILFFAYRNLIGNKRAFFTSLFVMSLPMFTMETPSMVKGLVSQTFLSLAVLFLFYPFKTWVKALGLSLALAGTIVNHYTVGFIATGIIVGIFGLKVLASLVKRRIVGFHWSILSSATVTVVIVLLMYYTFVGSGAMLGTLTAVGKNIAKITAITVTSQTNTPTPTTSVPMPPVKGEASLKDLYIYRTGGSGSGSYLQNQEELVKTALGLDFGTASTSGKVFRALQLLSEVLIVLGVFLVLVRRKLPFEYIAGAITCLLLILACILVPFFSTTVSATRFYSLSLFFLAPAFVIGAEFIMKGKLCGIRES